MMLRLILAMLLALASPATAQTAAAPVTPKVVVQAMSEGGFDVATWTPDSRFVFTASGFLRELLLWDVSTGAIVDRVRLPSEPGVQTEFLTLESMVLQPDGRTLRIDGIVLDQNSPDLRGGRAYAVDLHTRTVRIVTPRPLTPLPRGLDFLGFFERQLFALVSAHFGSKDVMTPAAAVRLLPALPRSPDGNWQMLRANPAFVLRDAAGQTRQMDGAARLQIPIGDADLSPDDQRLAFLSLASDFAPNTGITSVVELVDITRARFLTPLRLAGDYAFVRWVSASRFYVLPQDDKNDPLDSAAAGVPPPALLYDVDAGREVVRVPSRCFMATLPDGDLIGAGLANCRRNAGNDRQVVRLVNGQWQPLPGINVPAGAHVRLIAASPRGDRIAAVIRIRNGELAVFIADARTGKIGPSFEMKAGTSPALIGFSPDGSRVWLAANLKMLEWDVDAPPRGNGLPTVRELPVRSSAPKSFAAIGNRLLIGGPVEEQIEVIDLASGTALPSIAVPRPTSIGFMRNRPVTWVATTLDGLKLWNTSTGQLLMDISLLPNQRYVAVAGDGRYDTNLGPESQSFRWLMSDEPFKSLAPQTLMRDYYEPNLVTKLMDCAAANSCARVLKPVPPVATLNRQLPVVRITDIRPADTPGQVVVRVEARETRDAQNGRRSGLFNVKLLLNNRQIDQQPPHFQQQPSPTLAQWRELNQMEGVNAAGVWSSEFQVSVPTHHDGKPMEFAAYAFNSDRVKSDTARRSWTPPATSAPKRPRRAWVLTIGVDDYVEPRLKLNFAVADARVIAERLAAIPGYEMRHINLTSSLAGDGRPARQVTRADVMGVLSFLAGFPPEMNQMIRLEEVHKVRNLAETSPDDIVIISFSGHGFATASGQFALLPSNARWPATAAAPETRSVITAEDLTIQLGFMKAAEIAFIIDACHSGAAVNTPDFKPGPMGDASLGQLAFEKGLRILAATQADDVALENAALKQGFLTAALGEGLSDTGGPADLNSDGRIVLDEWLRYAVARLPSLNDEVRRGGGAMAARGVRLVMRTPSAAPPKSQEPSLFDFNSAPSPVVLRGRATQ